MRSWPFERMKYLVRINDRALSEDTDPDFEFRYIDITTVGRGVLAAEPERMRFSEAPSRARRLVASGDTIVSTVRTYLRAVWPVAEDPNDLAVSTGFAVLTPRTRLEPRYLGWWAQSDPFVEEIVARSVGVSYPAINASDVGDLAMPLPPLPEQRTIADYLDAETARIDALIAKKRRMIELLKEREQATRDEWMTELFGHFGAVPLRRIASSIEQGWSPQCDNVEASPEEWGVLRTSAVSAGVFAAEENKRLPPEVAPDRRWIVQDGDLLITRGSGSASMVGQVAVAETQGRRLLLSDLLYRVKLGQGTPRFVWQVLRSPYLRSITVSAIRTDAGQTLKVRLEDLKALPIPAAQLEEQERALCQLVGRLETLAGPRRAILAQMSLLTEHRQSLITAAVTGELAIPGVAA